ncbi:hypothetical protein DFH27DRAFT_125100 [Peziza echinospora]|nr:hypothetical protein DFH27DRAFT_125100 [Peziza echinospora]
MIGNPSAYTTTASYPHSFTFPPDRTKTEESSEIRCICGFTHDDGFTIACDQCDTWQHGYCVDIAETAVPDTYECPDCLPRPLDVRKAIEYQQEYSKNNEEKSRRKKTKAGTTSNPPRRKGDANSYHNNLAPNSAPERAVSSGKNGSTKERKRGTQRASISVTNGITVDSSHGTSGARITPNPPSPAATVATDRNIDGDSDTDMERPTKVYRFDFTDISDGPDHYVYREVQQHVASLADASEDTLIHISREQILPRALPNIPVHSVPESPKAYSSLPQYYITIDSQCSQGDLVAICKGDITFQHSYKADSINQYSVLRHPKPCVFFHPSQPLCIDSRIRGTVARFARRSCQPNTRLETVLVENSEIAFGLFAVEPLAPKTTITVGWEWDGCPPMQRLAEGAEPDQLDNEEYQDAISWANILMEHMGECACLDKDDCIFSKLRVKRESLTPKPFSSNARPRNTPGTSTPASSPDRQNSCDRDTGNRSSKSQSRDISPAHEETSHREARKIKEIISRIEKGDQPTVQKRRRRNNTLGASNAGVAQSKVGTKVENGRRSKTSSTAITPPPTIHLSKEQTDVLFQGAYESSLARSDDTEQSLKEMQPPPAPLSKKTKKSNYVDSCMQTDECEGAWWNDSPQDFPPRPCPLTLKERLLQSMMRERARAAKEETKKRKQNDMVDGGCSPIEPSKGAKLTKDSDVKTITPTSPLSTTCADLHSEVQSAEVVPCQPSASVVESSQSFEDDLNGSSSPDTRHSSPSPTESKTLSPPPSQSQSRGPALADIFADSPPQPATEVIPDHKRTPPVSPCSMDSNTLQMTTPPPTSTGRNFGLQVQLPTGPSFPTAPTTPSPVPASATSPAPPTPGPQPTSPLSVSAPTLNFPPSAPGSNFSTTKTKKLSLSEYNRRKRVDTANEIKDRKAMHAVSEEPQTMGPNDVASP